MKLLSFTTNPFIFGIKKLLGYKKLKDLIDSGIDFHRILLPSIGRE
jgi:hypothetical protein|tara:strand:+ start:304 stop:441 length:138 start_codon:yes stop_codon:yes gene_type:complete